MRALTTTAALLPATVRIPSAPIKLPAVRRLGSWNLLLPRRRRPTLFHRCLAVHMASAGTLSALR